VIITKPFDRLRANGLDHEGGRRAGFGLGEIISDGSGDLVVTDIFTQ